MVEVGRRISLNELKELRRQFGPGEAGKSAFRIVAKGAQCEGSKVNKDGAIEKCIEPAELTVDFDVPRVNVLEQLPSCSECTGKIQLKILEDVKEQGGFCSFSTNGRGRA